MAQIAALWVTLKRKKDNLIIAVKVPICPVDQPYMKVFRMLPTMIQTRTGYLVKLSPDVILMKADNDVLFVAVKEPKLINLCSPVADLVICEADLFRLGGPACEIELFTQRFNESFFHCSEAVKLMNPNETHVINSEPSAYEIFSPTGTKLISRCLDQAQPMMMIPGVSKITVPPECHVQIDNPKLYPTAGEGPIGTRWILPQARVEDLVKLFLPHAENLFEKLG